VRDQVVLITGASQGIGAACARLMGGRGAKLALFCLPDSGFESKLSDSRLIITGDNTEEKTRVLEQGVPGPVQDIRRTVSADQVACAIIRGLERRKRTVFVPRIGILFTSLDFFAPRIMDWYLRRFF